VARIAQKGGRLYGVDRVVEHAFGHAQKQAHIGGAKVVVCDRIAHFSLAPLQACGVPGFG
tara:strand:- start:44 stop:223 length:180 start_codon:yes stop_codon:yes gene_type:complete